MSFRKYTSLASDLFYIIINLFVVSVVVFFTTGSFFMLFLFVLFFLLCCCSYTKTLKFVLLQVLVVCTVWNVPFFYVYLILVYYFRKFYLGLFVSLWYTSIFTFSFFDYNLTHIFYIGFIFIFCLVIFFKKNSIINIFWFVVNTHVLMLVNSFLMGRSYSITILGTLSYTNNYDYPYFIFCWGYLLASVFGAYSYIIDINSLGNSVVPKGIFSYETKTVFPAVVYNIYGEVPVDVLAKQTSWSNLLDKNKIFLCSVLEDKNSVRDVSDRYLGMRGHDALIYKNKGDKNVLMSHPLEIFTHGKFPGYSGKHLHELYEHRMDIYPGYLKQQSLENHFFQSRKDHILSVPKFCNSLDQIIQINDRNLKWFGGILESRCNTNGDILLYNYFRDKYYGFYSWIFELTSSDLAVLEVMLKDDVRTYSSDEIKNLASIEYYKSTDLKFLQDVVVRDILKSKIGFMKSDGSVPLSERLFMEKKWLTDLLDKVNQQSIDASVTRIIKLFVIVQN